jgi:hypothetical protein
MGTLMLSHIETTFGRVHHLYLALLLLLTQTKKKISVFVCARGYQDNDLDRAYQTPVVDRFVHTSRTLLLRHSHLSNAKNRN